jgi:hypothetical protein
MKNEEWEPTIWGKKQQQWQKRPLKKIKRALTNALALDLPDMIKPFFLYVHERLRTVGVLTQLLGSWHSPVAYLSKQPDAVSPGWSPCLCALAATAILVAEADKLTLRQKLTVWVPHSVLTLMEYKENYRLTNSQIVKYQSMLCKNSHIQLEVVKTLNPATLLWVHSGPPEHDCIEITDEAFSSRPGLTNQAISHLDVECFTDGNSSVWKDVLPDMQ